MLSVKVADHSQSTFITTYGHCLITRNLVSSYTIHPYKYYFKVSICYASPHLGTTGYEYVISHISERPEVYKCSVS